MWRRRTCPIATPGCEHNAPLLRPRATGLLSAMRPGEVWPTPTGAMRLTHRAEKTKVAASRPNEPDA